MPSMFWNIGGLGEFGEKTLRFMFALTCYVRVVVSNALTDTHLAVWTEVHA